MIEQLVSALERLIAEADRELGDTETSVRGELILIGPIRDTELYKAVQDVEQTYHDKRLPDAIRQTWRSLLLLTDEERPQQHSKQQAISACRMLTKLKQWATQRLKASERELGILNAHKEDAELERSVTEKWSVDPIAALEEFRNCVVLLLEIVATTYSRAGETIFEDDDIFQPLVDQALVFDQHLKTSLKIWTKTPVSRFLTRETPVIVCSAENRRGRYDGCCYHEVALNFADGLITAIETKKTTCRQYCDQLQLHTGKGDQLADYLMSLIPDVRCEAQQGIERWKAHATRYAIASSPRENADNEMVTRQWIATRANIPEGTLRGPRFRKLLGPPDKSPPGKPALWKKNRALDFVANHGRN